MYLAKQQRFTELCRRLLRENQASGPLTKMFKIPSYLQSFYKSYDLPSVYWQKAFSPQDSYYSFTQINGPIHVEPMEKVLPPQAYEACMTALICGDIKPRQCYSNALIVAKILRGFGYQVRCVDSLYRVKNASDRYCKHRFNEFNGHCFDITGEYILCRPCGLSVSTIEYTQGRSFTLNELLSIAFAYGSLRGNPKIPYFYSTLKCNFDTDAPDDTFDWYINDNGLLERC